MSCAEGMAPQPLPAYPGYSSPPSPPPLSPTPSMRNPLSACPAVFGQVACRFPPTRAAEDFFLLPSPLFGLDMSVNLHNALQRSDKHPANRLPTPLKCIYCRRWTCLPAAAPQLLPLAGHLMTCGVPGQLQLLNAKPCTVCLQLYSNKVFTSWVTLETRRVCL